MANIIIIDNISELNYSIDKSIIDDWVKAHTLDLSLDNIVLIVMYILTFFAGFIGNGFLVFIILCRRRFRSMTNFFLCNLAVSDLAGKATYMLVIPCL